MNRSGCIRIVPHAATQRSHEFARRIEIAAGTSELVLGGLYACASVLLLVAAYLDAGTLSPGMSGLVVLSCFAATAASFFTVGGCFLRSGLEGRYSVQIVSLPFAAIGAIYPLKVIAELYL